MSPAGSFPLNYPGDARRAFGSDELTRRFARVAQLEPGSRVLVLGGSPVHAAVLLARDLGCSVVAADTEEGPLSPVRERVRALSLGDRVDVRRIDLGQPGFPEGEFDAVLIQGRVFSPLTHSLRSLRRVLSLRGRLGMIFPSRVGRFLPKASTEFWEKRLGAPLLLPRELLLAMESEGYEPESVETLPESDLDGVYQDVEAHLEGLPEAEVQVLRQEIALHREQHGKPGVSLSFFIGRRKEPGEKPPASRDRG
jgi:ubiquinone/menaquinone biosynthesis C-methylase UbiE